MANDEIGNEMMDALPNDDIDISSLTDEEMEKLLDFLDKILAERTAAVGKIDGAMSDSGGMDSVGDIDKNDVSDENVKDKKQKDGGKKSDCTVSDMNVKQNENVSKDSPANKTQENIARVLGDLRF